MHTMMRNTDGFSSKFSINSDRGVEIRTIAERQISVWQLGRSKKKYFYRIVPHSSVQSLIKLDYQRDITTNQHLDEKK